MNNDKNELWKQLLEQGLNNDELVDIINEIYTYDSELLKKACTQLLKQTPCNDELRHIINSSQIILNDELIDEACEQLFYKNYKSNKDLTLIIRYSCNQEIVEKSCKQLITKNPNDYDIKIIKMHSKNNNTLEYVKKLCGNNKYKLIQKMLEITKASYLKKIKDQ